MTVKQFTSFAADLIAVALMIWQMVRLRNIQEDKDSLKQFFKRLCLVVLLMAALNLLKVYSDIQLGTFTMQDFGKISETEQTLWYVTEIIAGIADVYLTTVFLYMWLTYLGWYLFKDRDFIKRKFWVGFTPLIIAAVISAVSIPLALMSEQGFAFYVTAICLFFVIRIVYFMMSLWLLYEYKKENGYLRFFNPWVFFIPVFAGWILQDLFMCELASLGSTLGVVLLFISMQEEKQYIDPQTGFYNSSFVDYLKDLIAKGKYSTCSAMIFTLADSYEMVEFSNILKKQLPQNCEPIVMGNRVVVLANVPDKAGLKMVIEDVKEAFDVETTATLKKKTETTIGFMERVL